MINVVLKYHCGSDLSVVNSARVSFDKESSSLSDKDEKLLPDEDLKWEEDEDREEEVTSYEGGAPDDN